MSAIFKWAIVLLILIAAAGGGGAYWCYVRSDEMLRVEVVKQLHKMAPELKFELERANFDFSGRIRLNGLAVQLPGGVEPSFYVPEAVVTLDDQQMTNFENVAIRRLRLVHPQLHVVRQPDGRWNWQGIQWRPERSTPVPEIEVEHGTIVVELHRQRHAVRTLKVADLNITAVPSAARKLTAVVSTRIEPAGPLTATIDADLDALPLGLQAKWLRVPVDDDLLQLIGELSPEANARLLDARQALARLAATQAAALPIPSGPHPGGPPELPASPIGLKSQLSLDSRPEPAPLGLKLVCDLHCRLRWANRDAPPQFQILAELHAGQFSHQVLPFPLYELRGSVYADPQQVIIRDFKAENGAARVTWDCRFAPGSPPRLKLQIRNLPIDAPLTARLPESVRKIVLSLSLSGTCDLDLKSVRQGDGVTWEADLRVTDGFVSHEKFRYPIRDVAGTVRLRGETVEIEATGKAGGVPIMATGRVRNPGPSNECELLIRADGAPINDVLRDACPAGIRKALIELNAQGLFDTALRISRDAGIGMKYRLTTAIQLRDCSCLFRGFPYRIHGLRGRIDWDDEVIAFTRLSGHHDQTRLTATGRFLRSPLPGRLELEIHAEDAAFDRSLELAVPPSLRGVWDEFRPSGRLDLDARIAWVPGQPCHVVLPRIKVAGGEIAMRSFLWPLRAIEGEFSYEAPRLVIKSLSAQHDDTMVRCRGLALFAAGEPWRVRFDELHVDDLVPNATFRRALPPSLQRMFDTLNPSGRFSVATTPGGTVELAGTDGDRTIASAWDVQVLLSDCGLSAGIRLDHIHGRIGLKGSHDGVSTRLTGSLDLDSVSVFRQPSGMAHQISRVVGPISLQDGQFVGGSRLLATPPTGAPPPPVPLADRISGDAIDGKLTLDIVADLGEEPDYRMQVTLSRGRLESYAQQYLRGQSNLAGIMNGWLYLWGKGQGEDRIKGRGELQIAPAALYELPLFVQIFQALRLDAVDRTAFDRADVLFNIQNARFNFDAIDLVGKAISLRGRGYIRFDGAMQLDFYSMLARNQIRIPVVHEIAGMLSRGWVGVKVTGNVGAPQTRIVPVPEFDDAMKQFLGSFEPPSMQGRPNPFIPNILRPKN